MRVQLCHRNNNDWDTVKVCQEYIEENFDDQDDFDKRSPEYNKFYIEYLMKFGHSEISASKYKAPTFEIIS